MLIPAIASAQTQVLDDFHDLSAWTISTTNDVQASLRSVPGPHGQALCIDFDFGQVTGYVAARRTLPIEFPPRYALTLGVRGEAPPNALQFKLVDASGENVWWVQRPEFRFPADWQTLKFRQRQIGFAWGPTTDRTLQRTASIELVIASGSGAGKGSACFDRLTLERLPDAAPVAPPALMSADALGVDFGIPREFGALTLRWRHGTAPSRYAIERSDDGLRWYRARQIDGARGAVQAHWLPDSEARYVRVVPDGAAGRYALDAIDITAPQAVETVDAWFAQLARGAERGRYPRAYVGEQPYWTVLGVAGGALASLISEDGTIEPLPGVGGVEPFLVEDGQVLSWADARIGHDLRDGDLPMPAVHWRLGDVEAVGPGEHANRDALTLDIAAFGSGTPAASQLLASYTVRNRSKRPREVDLALAWRPFQANPPTQFLAHPGGASALRRIAWDGGTLVIDGAPRLQPLARPDSVRMEPRAAGPVGDWLAQPPESAAASAGLPQQVDDAEGYASAVLRYRLRLAPGEARTIRIALPVAGDVPVPTATQFAAAERQVAAGWRAQIDRVRLSGPPEVADIARTLRTSLAHILLERAGPALQPGPRAYARSWIRDGALTSAALLRLGHADAARDFLRWYAGFQFSDGKVPCCATFRGADPVPENDADGEFAYAAWNLWRYSGDTAGARALWPNVRAAVAHMERLAASERTDANRTPERRAYFGLMPPSISHEGYSDRPAYSYWDDFWAAIGYRSAGSLAHALGETADAVRIDAERMRFDIDLLASINAATAQHGMSVLPGAADRGDVDPTSSTIALSPGGFYRDPLSTGTTPTAPSSIAPAAPPAAPAAGTAAEAALLLPDRLVRNTFERYWRDFEGRVRDEAAGRRHGDGAYTPYEWRDVGALVRLGERERALQALRYFYRDRRPAGWNQWAEVVARDPREPRFLGDMPHGWVASDHIRSVLDGFAYEHEGADRLVLAAGVPMAWLAGRGVAIEGLRTPWGALGWRAVSHDRGGRTVIDFRLDHLQAQPPGGLELRGPWPAASTVEVDGRAVAGSADRIAIIHTPAVVRITLPADAPPASSRPAPNGR